MDLRPPGIVSFHLDTAGQSAAHGLMTPPTSSGGRFDCDRHP